MKTVIVRYAEIALKSPPVRRRFENLLLRNIRVALGSVPHEIRKLRGRIFVDTNKPVAVSETLSGIPGIVSVSPAVRIPADLDEISAEAVRIAKECIRPGQTFAVRSSREGTHPFTSREVNERVGKDILSAVKGARVDLSSPQQKIFIEIRGRDAYIFKEVIGGVGGLPVDSQGSVLVIFSGGGKDLTAAFLMLKRGCLPKLLLTPGDAVELRKGISAVRKLLKHHPRLDLFIVPFNELVKSIRNFPPRIRFYMRRRALIRTAELVAEKVRAEALVLGDDVQLLSTRGLGDMGITDRAGEMVVLRPLAGAGMKNLATKTPAPKITPRRVGIARPAESELAALEREGASQRLLKRAVKRMRKITLEARR